MSEHHIVMPKTYISILVCLFFLMGATIFAATIDLGSTANLLLALFIACCKMSLILMFFMHVKYGSKLTQVFALSGFIWLIIFFTLLFCDYKGRGADYGNGAAVGIMQNEEINSPFAKSPYES